MLVRVNAIDTVTIEDRGRITVLPIGNERYEIVESYEEIFWKVDGRYNK